jgi:hypothetical protein
VLQVSDDHDRVLAFVKAGHNDLTRALVRHEHACLSGLVDRAWRHVTPPRALALVEWRDLTLLVLTPLPMPAARLPPEVARERLLCVVDEIATGVGITQIAWRDHPLRKRLQRSLATAGAAASTWLEELSRLPDDVIVPTGAWHGDLNPGNMALTWGPCPVWDWERCETDVPLGFDLLHHDLQELITVRRMAPPSAVAHLLSEAPAMLARWGMSAGVAATASRAYLITLAERYMADDQVAAGATLGAVDQWILPALSESR